MELRQILARVDELKAQIDALRPIQPEQEQRILQKFRLDWNYHSNAIEGNSLTLGETRAFLLEGLTAKGKPFKDHLDIRGHNQLILFLEDFVRQKQILTEAAIREMHKILLVEPYQVEARTPDGQATKKWVKLGEYKTEPNAVQTATGEWIYYARPEDTAPRMAELVAWYRQQVETRAEHPLLVATLFHHRFTHIHPFDDGNGRMARALMNVILMREGFPPVVIKLEARAAYVSALRTADSGDSGELSRFIGEGMVAAQELFLRGAKGEELQELDDLDKEITLLKQQLRAVPDALPLSPEALQRTIDLAIIPLVHQTSLKLRQFDDLFASVKRHFETAISRGPGCQVIRHLSFQQPAESRDRIREMVAKEKLEVLVFRNEWSVFKKGGLGCDFEMGLAVAFAFGDLKYSVSVENPHFKRDYAYAQAFPEQDLRELVQLLTRDCLSKVRKATSAIETN